MKPVLWNCVRAHQAHRKSGLLALLDVQGERWHDDQDAVGCDVQNGLRQCDIVETRVAADDQRVTGPGDDDSEHDCVRDDGTSSYVQGYSETHPNVDAMVESDEGELGERGRPEVCYCEEEKRLHASISV